MEIITPLGDIEKGEASSLVKGDYVITFTMRSVLFNVNCQSTSMCLAGWL